MRRGRTIAVAVLALLGVLAPPALAQVPAPTVTINGLLDNVNTFGRNAFDTNFASAKDHLWASRTRGVFTITGEVGKAKGVLALELDLGWGQASGGESANSAGGGSGTISSSVSGIGSLQRANQAGSFDVGNDVMGVIEIKNLYVEFPVPLIPLPTVARLGGQPFQVTYKPSALATTDYGGVWAQTTITPNLKFNLTFAQFDENDVGFRASSGNFFRGDDYFLSPSVDITPFKGLDLRPLYGWLYVYGNSGNQIRCRVQCAGLPSNGSMINVNQFGNGSATSLNLTATAPTLGNYRQNSHESRQFPGTDGRFPTGPFYLAPPFIYEPSHGDVYRNDRFGEKYTSTAEALVASQVSRNQTLAGSALTQGFGTRVHQRINSWLIDVRGGWRLGPLLVEGIVIATPGDAAQHDSFKSSNVYHGVAADGAYGGSWQEILSPGSVDYFTGNGPAQGENWGLGRYGRRMVGTKLTYSVTPAFDVNFKASANWTATQVNTYAPAGASTSTRNLGNFSGSFGATPCSGPNGFMATYTDGFGATAFNAGNQSAFIMWSAHPSGDHSYVGLEAGPGITYRFALGLTFDMIYSHLFAGPALNSAFVDTNNVFQYVKAKDADLVAARVRFQF